MNTQRITIDLAEYERLKNTIKQKDEYIHNCEIEGKIKRNDVYKVLFSKYVSDYFIPGRINIVSDDYTPYLTESQLEKIKDDELKSAIKEIYEHKEAWESDFNKKMNELQGKQTEMLNKSFAERLKYLFTGKTEFTYR